MNPLDNDINLIDLVKKAQFGCQESMDILAQRAQRGLFAYIYRLTLNYNVTEDLQQETLLEMVKSLKTLEHPERFWAWLYRTALGKVQHYFRDRQYEKVIQPMSTLDKEKLLQRVSGSYGDGLKNLINKELSQAIVDAMAKLKLRHRNILVLRCCEQLPYSEIAEVMDCSEIAAQVLFFRAKHSLKRKLSKHGFGKGMLLTALGLFGRMTAPADAAPITVSAASTKVGVAATVIGAAGTKLGLTIATVVTLGAIAAGTILSAKSKPDAPNTVYRQESTVNSQITAKISEGISVPQGSDAITPNAPNGLNNRASTIEDKVTSQDEIPNLAIESVEIVDVNGNPITATAGERFWVRVNFTYINPVCTYYKIKRVVNGRENTAPEINWGSGYSGVTNWNHVWGPWAMHKGGTYSATIILDADGAIEESNETDNTATIYFSVTGNITADYELINAEYGRKNLGDGTGVIVGIMDDAFDFQHPWYRGNDSNGNPRLVASRQNSLGTEGSPINASHATAVMGSVLARGINDGDITGLAPDARYVTVEFLNLANEPNLSVLNILDAVEFLVNNGVDVINMSWSLRLDSDDKCLSGESPVSNLLADYLAYGHNTVCVAMTDRFEDYNSPAAPGSSRNVITVGGFDKKLERAWPIDNYGPTLDGRCKPDVIAPGVEPQTSPSIYWRSGIAADSGYDIPHEWYHNIPWKVQYDPPIKYTVDASEYYFGTEFSAAFVTGAVAQMLDYGRRNGENTDHRVIKAIIMNSGVKAKDADGSPWSNSLTRPLDDEQGTGVLNIERVYAMYSAGEQPPQAAKVPGYDFDEVIMTVDDGPMEGRVIYRLGQLQTDDSSIDITLVWDRHTFWNDKNNNNIIDANDSFFTDPTDCQDNLDLVLFCNGVEVAASRSKVDNVEHISLTRLMPGRYELHVERLPVSKSGNSEEYAIAWYSDGRWGSPNIK
jgi:RNA polymerase sigma-70 factor (ECF subfamily)